MLKKIIFGVSGCLLAFASQAAQLDSFSAISHAVHAGKPIRIVMTMNQCQLSNGSKVPENTIGFYQPSSIIVLNNKAITASNLHFTMEDRQAPNQPVYEWVLYKITPNNILTMQATALSAVNYAPVSKTIHITCQLNKGVKVYG